ncbi:hypothetical protein Tco_0776857 [Tanacetum coccineum]
MSLRRFSLLTYWCYELRCNNNPCILTPTNSILLFNLRCGGCFFSSTNASNYISTPPGYSPVTSGNISPDSLDNLTKDILSLLSILPFHDNPYMKVVQAYDAIPPPQIIIALSAIVPPPMFDSRDFFPPKEISLPKDTETPVESPIPVSLSSSVGSSSPGRSTTSPSDYLLDESIFAELDNSL